jgi:flagella basal body P-ring formation protein FlgA
MRLAILTASFVCFAGAAFADTVTLRSRIEASGPAIIMGDVFDGAPANVANRAIAPAPAPGQVATLSIPLLAAVASAAGLEWTPPDGVNEVRVVRPGGMRATLPGGAPALTDIVIRRGETATIVFQQQGLELGIRGVRAAENGAVGQRIRFINTASNRTIEAIVTGPGAARAEAP